MIFVLAHVMIRDMNGIYCIKRTFSVVLSRNSEKNCDFAPVSCLGQCLWKESDQVVYVWGLPAAGSSLQQHNQSEKKKQIIFPFDTHFLLCRSPRWLMSGSFTVEVVRVCQKCEKTTNRMKEKFHNKIIGQHILSIIDHANQIRYKKTKTTKNSLFLAKKCKTAKKVFFCWPFSKYRVVYFVLRHWRVIKIHRNVRIVALMKIALLL